MLDDTDWGRILKIEPNRILVLTSHGFENYYKPNQIVPEQGSRDMLLSVSWPAAREKMMRDKSTGRQAAAANTGKVGVPEIDLHIENLLDNWQRMSNYDILQYQLKFFRRRLERLMEQRVPKVVVIHGRGEGVLRNEIRMELLKHSNIEFLDGSYLEYGIGATELRIRYSHK